MRILTLTKETQQNILENLLKRSPNSYGEYEGRVNAIIEEVRANRDAAVFSYTKKFDGADIDAGNILVTEEEIRESLREGRSKAPLRDPQGTCQYPRLSQQTAPEFLV